MANPNLLDATTIQGKTSTVALTTSAQAIVNNPASSGKLMRVVSLYVSNVDGASAATVTLRYYSQDDLGGTAYAITNVVSVPAGASLQIIGKDFPLYLEEDKSLGALASASGDLEIVCSYEECS